jgi:hypothetical protein
MKDKPAIRSSELLTRKSSFAKASNFAKASMDRSENGRNLPPSPALRDSARRVGAAEAGVSLPVNKILK